VTFADQTVYFARDQIDAGKQRKRSMAAIFVVTTREALSRLRRPIRMNVPNSLNSRLLVIRTLKSSKAPTNYFTPNILRKSWSRLVVSVVHLDALAFPVAAT